MTVERESYSDIREAVAKLCARFPGEYWRSLDRDMIYPSEFVKELTDAGWLAALIPEEYGGAGLPLSAAAAILEEIQLAGCNGGACHAQMYTMGTLLRHGSDRQKQKYLPKIANGSLRLQAFGVTEPTSGTDTGALKTTAKLQGDHYVVNGQKIWTSRAEHSDLHAPSCPHHATCRGHEENRWPVRTVSGYAKSDREWAYNSPHPHHDEPRNNRSFLRQPQSACRKSNRRRGQGLSLYSVRNER